MKLQLPDPDAGFLIKTSAKYPGWRLIVPGPTKHRWLPKERFYRSVILDKDNNILSMGFPKFGNYGEPGFEDIDNIFERDDLSDQIVMTDKLDGMMILRSIIDNKVHYRTRGNFDCGEYQYLVEREVAKYPRLADPSIHSNGTLIFELISPENRIVLPYQYSDLILVGAYSEYLHWSDWGELRLLAKYFDLKLVEEITLNSHILAQEILEQIEVMKGLEGYVARRGAYMTKIKTLEYLKLHRLRFQMSEKALRAICDDNKFKSAEDFKRYIEGEGGDWELFAACEPSLNKYFETLADVQHKWITLLGSSAIACENYPERRDYAIQYANNLEPYEKPSAFLLYDGRNEEAKVKLHKSMMDNAFQNDQAFVEEA